MKIWTWEETTDLSPQQCADYLNELMQLREINAPHVTDYLHGLSCDVRPIGAVSSHNHGNCELCDALERAQDSLIKALREIVEQWRLIALQPRVEDPEDPRILTLTRCYHQLHALIEAVTLSGHHGQAGVA